MTPQIRFPEFTDEWQVKLLGKIFDVRDGTHESPAYFDHGKPLLTSKNLKPNGTLDLDNVSYISQHDFDSINRRSGVNVGDILFGMIGTIGNPVKVESSDFAIKNVALLKPGEVSSNYLIQYLRSQIIEKQFYQKNAGGTQKFIALGDIRELNIGTPSKPEQEKIADFLTAIDERIATSEHKCELLARYKRGVMQQLFSQKIRFKKPDGINYSDWQEKKLGEVFEYLRTNSLSRSELHNSGEVMNIHYGDIHTKLGAHFDAAIDKVSYLKLANKSDFVQNGDLIIADASEDRFDIGKSTEVLNANGSKIVSGLHTFLVRPKNLALGFAGYLMQSEQIRRQLWRIATGASVLGISKTELSKLTVNLPTPEEQQKIANLLTTLDDKITAEQSKLTAAKQLKKALLQRMFV